MEEQSLEEVKERELVNKNNIRLHTKPLFTFKMSADNRYIIIIINTLISFPLNKRKFYSLIAV